MDFARPHEKKESLATKSNIKLVPVADPNSSDLDQMVLHYSNQAARELLLAGLSQDHDEWVDASLYPERLTPRKETIQLGDLVVIMESFDRLTFVYVAADGVFHNRNGSFDHQSFVGQPFGSKVRSTNNRGFGFIYLLKPTPELWARSLNHRTQIVHELDQSQIILQLYLQPNMTVVESGTGSGAMSHGFLRSIAPAGHLHTFEFNQKRAETARTEFQSNGLDHLVTVHHKDACAGGGFGLPGASVDAVFLDLPEPWVAVPHAAWVLKANARLASYSPCVEQTQRTVAALQKAGFHSIKTMEYRLQEHYVDEVEYERPPRAKRPKYVASENPFANPEGGTVTEEEKTDSKVVQSEPEEENGKDEESTPQKGDKHVVARPFVLMRGHTAFLTFATAGNEAHPDPNAVSKT